MIDPPASTRRDQPAVPVDPPAWETGLDAITKGIFDVFWIADADCNEILYVSQSYERVWGRSRESLYAAPANFIETIHQEDRQKVLDIIGRKRQAGIPYEGDYRIVRPDGSIRYIWDRGFPLINDEGLFVGVAQDVTEHKREVDELLLFKRIAINSTEAIAISDCQGKLLFVNPAHETLFGCSLQEAQAHNYRDYYPPESVEILEREVAPILAKGGTWEGILDVLDASGRRFPLWERAESVCDAEGRFRMAFGYMHEIASSSCPTNGNKQPSAEIANTEQKQVQQKLERSLLINKSLAEFSEVLISQVLSLNEIADQALNCARALTGSAHGLVSLVDPNTSQSYCLKRTRMMEAKTESEPGSPIVFPKRPDGLFPHLWGHALNTRQAFYTNAPKKHPASTGTPPGHEPLHNFLSVPAMLGNKLMGQIAVANADHDYDDEDLGAVRRLIDLFVLACDRREQQNLLWQSETRYNAVADFTFDWEYWTDPAGQLQYISPSCERITGHSPEEFQQDPSLLLSIIHPEDRSLAALKHGKDDAGDQECAFTVRIVRPDGKTRWIDHLCRRVYHADGEYLGRRGSNRDITEQKLLEDQLSQTQDEIRRLRNCLRGENLLLRKTQSEQAAVIDMVGQSPVFQHMLMLAEQVAATDATVLLLGETGTGKELLARTIHKMSLRRVRPMVCVNCAALPATLIESELFGREKGAYTGALSHQIGRFEMANGSTVFLDEIGDLSPELQVKLLRVLAEKQIERLGGCKSIPVDVRVIAATHRDLGQAIQEGWFRQDLFYRLNVFPIRVPPLRDHRDDIPLLVWSFIGQLNQSMGKNIEAVDESDLDALMQYSWPGNIRELRNLVERAMILANGSRLRITLPDPVANAASHVSPPSSEEERIRLRRVLENTGWRIRGPHGAAETLGLKPTTLESRMKALGIHRPTR